ncbi:MAG TPA: hypothetical protein PKU95_00070 [Candidatus Dojkabacteria bacterium]|nr:hypothetical protein [Candidatus Dojkabacteria bacterium]
MGILQEGIEVIDPRVSFSKIDELNYQGQTLPKPEYVCFISPKVPVPLLLTSAGLKVADVNCLFCAHSRGECPISALSNSGRKELRKSFDEQINRDRPKGEKWYAIPGLIGLVAERIQKTLLLPPKLMEGICDYSEPYQLDFRESNIDKDQMAEV